MKSRLPYFLVLLIGNGFAIAGEMGDVKPLEEKLRPLVSLQGGYAAMAASTREARFVGNDNNLFVYTPSGSSSDTGFYGLFVGVEHFLRQVSNYPVWLQAGFEYDGFGQVDIKGINRVGVDASSSTQYRYAYAIQTQQVLGGIKLLTAAHARLHPYGEAGIGIAFNRTSAYSASTSETGSMNVTPNFSNQSTTKLSYILGLGLDTQLNTHIRCGLGYRYSYFGTASLGNGWVLAGDSDVPVSFKVSTSGLYANQLLARITYIV